MTAYHLRKNERLDGESLGGRRIEAESDGKPVMGGNTHGEALLARQTERKTSRPPDATAKSAPELKDRQKWQP